MHDDQKWLYIEKIKELGEDGGQKLLDLMTAYNCNNLREVTYDQAKEFYEKHTTN